MNDAWFMNCYFLVIIMFSTENCWFEILFNHPEIYCNKFVNNFIELSKILLCSLNLFWGNENARGSFHPDNSSIFSFSSPFRKVYFLKKKNSPTWMKMYENCVLNRVLNLKLKRKWKTDHNTNKQKKNECFIAEFKILALQRVLFRKISCKV